MHDVWNPEMISRERTLHYGVVSLVSGIGEDECKQSLFGEAANVACESNFVVQSRQSLSFVSELTL